MLKLPLLWSFSALRRIRQINAKRFNMLKFLLHFLQILFQVFHLFFIGFKLLVEHNEVVMQERQRLVVLQELQLQVFRPFQERFCGIQF